MKGFLEYDGPIFSILQKLGNMIMLNILFLICCIPIVTIGSAATSLYYATAKSIQHERGYVTQEFLASMKRTWKKATIITIVLLAWLACLLFGIEQQTNGIYLVILLITMAIVTYLFPVMSRFEIGIVATVKLAFLMSIRHIVATLILLAGTLAVSAAMFLWLPMPCILFVPALWCYLASFLIERVLRAYMKPYEELTDEEKNAWYYQDCIKFSTKT